VDGRGLRMMSCKVGNPAKTTLHHRLTSTLHALLQVLAPLAQFTPSARTVYLEPQVLPAPVRRNRPGDVMFDHLDASLDFGGTLVDLSLVSPPRAPPSSSSSSAQSADSLQTTLDTIISPHVQREHVKFRGSQPEVMPLLHDMQLLLLPFTVGHQGEFGPLASLFLSGRRHLLPALWDLTPSVSSEGRGSTPASTQASLAFPSLPSLHDLLGRADRAWSLLSPGSSFTRFAQIRMPSHYFHYTWGSHFLRALHDGLSSTASLIRSAPFACSQSHRLPLAPLCATSLPRSRLRFPVCDSGSVPFAD